MLETYDRRNFKSHSLLDVLLPRADFRLNLEVTVSQQLHSTDVPTTVVRNVTWLPSQPFYTACFIWTIVTADRTPEVLSTRVNPQRRQVFFVLGQPWDSISSVG